MTALTVFLEYSYYGSFGRCYALLLLLCMLTAASWKNRLRRPWLTSLCIGLLASVHLMAWPLCLVLACIHTAELVRAPGSRLRLLSPLAGLVPAALFCVPLRPQIQNTFAKFGWNPGLVFALLGLAAAAAVTLLALLPSVLGKKKQLLSGLYAAFYAVLPVFIAVSTYAVLVKATSSTIAAETNLLHLCEIVPLLLGTAWICAQRRGELTREEGAEKQAPADAAQQPAADSSEDNPAASVRENPAARASVWESARVTSLVLALILLWSFYLNSGENALHKIIWMDTKSYYSGSEPLAEYIRENVPKDAVIVATRRGTNTSVAAYLDGDYTLTCLLSHEPLYYTKWCSDWPHPIPRSEWLPDLISLMEEHGELYVIYSDDTEVSDFSAWLWRLIDEGDAQMVYHSNAYGEALTDVPDDYKPIERCETMGLYKITAID